MSAIFDKKVLTGGFRLDESLLDDDVYGEAGLWNIFREFGFISVAAFENCDHRIPRATGRMPKIDIVSRNFY